MNKFYLLLFIIITKFSFGQDVTVFNGYSHIYFLPLEYQSGKLDVWGISAESQNYFEDKGFKIITDTKTLQDRPCLLLRCVIDHPDANEISNKVTLSFYNCLNQLVYKTKGKGGLGLNISGDFRIAVKKALRAFNNYKYSFDYLLTPK